jgi:ribosomal protein RSM22 (predicted rRNA methylase)
MSYSERPGDIDIAIANWLQEQDGALLRANSDQLTERYRAGQTSARVDLAAYLTTRMPATYAAVRKVLEEVARVYPAFAPVSMLDMGAGPGTASWAALAEWPELSSVTMIETDARFVELAGVLAKGSALEALTKATITRAKMNEATAKADLVIAAYVFAELVEKDTGEAALKLWAQTENTLVIIEPGTPRGFARIHAARQMLIKAGAHINGPCTHAAVCPMRGNDWCHFTVRLARSREHMHAKQATVPFEDEPFSWIAVSRTAVPLSGARVIRPPEQDKHSITFKVCDEQGITDRAIARRDKAAYKQRRKLAWGDIIADDMKGNEDGSGSI